VGASEHEELVLEARRAFETLAPLLGPNSALPPKALESVRRARAEVERVLGREGTRIALAGERRSCAELDGFLGATIFAGADASGPGPILVLERGESPSYSAQLRDGTVEDFDVAVPDRKHALDSELRVFTEERDFEDGRVPTAPFRRAPLAPRAGFLGWLDRIWAAIVALFSRPKAPPPMTEAARERRAFVEAEIERLTGERSRADESRHAEFARRARAMIDRGVRASEVAEVRIRYPTNGIAETMSLVDLRGPMAAGQRDESWVRIRTEVDACLLVLDGYAEIGPATRDLAKELCVLAPHLLLVADPSERTRGLLRALRLEPSRVLYVSPSVSSSKLTQLFLNERTLMAGLRTTAAVRLARQSVEEKLARDEAPDREAIERLRAHGVPSEGSREELQRRVSAACAGRAVRVLQGTVAALDAGLAVIKDDAQKALEGTRTRDELKASVQTTGASLRSVRETLESQVQSLVDVAVAELAPTLLRDLERRLDQVAEAATATLPPRPEWPAAPRAEAPVAALVAHATLEAAEALKAELTWTDAWLRSFDNVKKRAATRLAEQLGKISNAARAEILGAEPLMASALARALGAFVDGAEKRYADWLEEVIAAETALREERRLQRAKPLIAQRDALLEHEKSLSAQGRRVAASSHEIAGTLTPHEPPASTPPLA
jgi:hypothetical protein